MPTKTRACRGDIGVEGGGGLFSPTKNSLNLHCMLLLKEASKIYAYLEFIAVFTPLFGFEIKDFGNFYTTKKTSKRSFEVLQINLYINLISFFTKQILQFITGEYSNKNC